MFAQASRYGYIRLLGVKERGRRAFDAMTRDENGQTSTEYLMIVGLMAAVILLAFVTFFWETIKGAAQNWSGKVGKAIEGEQVK
jgi:Flp pilus assembly pilin Flp